MSKSMPKNLKIGFEFHAQVATEQKLYCPCPTNYMVAEPNEYTCEVCIGLPGSKPFPVNKSSIDAAIEVALLAGCEVSTSPIVIQRKHYDYPDLPNGYQKTSIPIAINGHYLDVGIRELHIEDDPGRFELSKGRIDFNRCGVPLVELVTEPDLRSPEQAKEFWKEMALLLSYTGKFRTEPGTMRSDVNISMGPTRVEVKNVNSATGVYNAIIYEIKRQQKSFRRGKDVIRETRAFLEDKMITALLREKETAADYRYIPDPDIPPITVDQIWIDSIAANLIEPPAVKRKRFVESYGINDEVAHVLVDDKPLSELFESITTQMHDKVYAANWTAQMLRNVLIKTNQRPEIFKEDSIALATLSGMMKEQKIARDACEEILIERVTSGTPINELVNRRTSKVEQKIDLENILERILAESPDAVVSYKTGATKSFNYLVGQVMKATQGTADPIAIAELLKRKLLTDKILT